jgi:hypothetical protein
MARDKGATRPISIQLEQTPLTRSRAILRSLGRSATLVHTMAISNHKFPSKLLFTHFMERSASVANIKCVNSNLLGNL